MVGAGLRQVSASSFGFRSAFASLVHHSSIMSVSVQRSRVTRVALDIWSIEW
jgi:hypothetical protein